MGSKGTRWHRKPGALPESTRTYNKNSQTTPRSSYHYLRDCAWQDPVGHLALLVPRVHLGSRFGAHVFETTPKSWVQHSAALTDFVDQQAALSRGCRQFCKPAWLVTTGLGTRQKFASRLRTTLQVSGLSNKISPSSGCWGHSIYTETPGPFAR